MNPYSPGDELPIERLAAYVDGELNEACCAQVEAWLADHPDARADLDDQLEYSPANEEFWDAVAPPMPTPAQWDGAFARIESRLVRLPMPARPSRRATWYLAPALAMAVLAASVLVAVVGIKRDLPAPANNSLPSSVLNTIDPGEDDVFQIATADDVDIIQLPEEASSLIVVGRHPMTDTPLVLASTTDLDIYHLGPDDLGRMPHVEMSAGPNTPMVVAQSPRR